MGRGAAREDHHWAPLVRRTRRCANEPVDAKFVHLPEGLIGAWLDLVDGGSDADAADVLRLLHSASDFRDPAVRQCIRDLCTHTVWSVRRSEAQLEARFAKRRMDADLGPIGWATIDELVEDLRHRLSSGDEVTTHALRQRAREMFTDRAEALLNTSSL